MASDPPSQIIQQLARLELKFSSRQPVRQRGKLLARAAWRQTLLRPVARPLMAAR
jgi:hypothetical protein